MKIKRIELLTAKIRCPHCHHIAGYGYSDGVSVRIERFTDQVDRSEQELLAGFGLLGEPDAPPTFPRCADLLHVWTVKPHDLERIRSPQDTNRDDLISGPMVVTIHGSKIWA